MATPRLKREIATSRAPHSATCQSNPYVWPPYPVACCTHCWTGCPAPPGGEGTRRNAAVVPSPPADSAKVFACAAAGSLPPRCLSQPPIRATIGCRPLLCVCTGGCSRLQCSYAVRFSARRCCQQLWGLLAIQRPLSTGLGGFLMHQVTFNGMKGCRLAASHRQVMQPLKRCIPQTAGRWLTGCGASHKHTPCSLRATAVSGRAMPCSGRASRLRAACARCDAFTLLQRALVLFIGDSTSRRAAYHLHSMMSNLPFEDEVLHAPIHTRVNEARGVGQFATITHWMPHPENLTAVLLAGHRTGQVPELFHRRQANTFSHEYVRL